ncbi:MAG: ATP-binding cassette domain-containing protein [bacterium]|nr:ATP-binding cassette domain-containing protein [bacterium]
MSKDTVIKIENLSKQYRLGLVSTGTLSHDINRLWAKVRGKDDPYLKIGDTNDRSTKGQSDYVWALKDISLEIKCGERIGIIGQNGAGKSTLLKILSEVTGPTTGRIKIQGRTASLLEVGTGFHQELTGRENIYMNGTILGMSRFEITKKLDEIVDFSGVEKYLDTPVKRYSSGMMVRLGFAVAAHLEPDILIVDEVLAVGDVEFQKKAIGKMQEVSDSQGRTILFVSHNMTAIKKLCKKCILLKNGNINFIGDPKSTIKKYLATNLPKLNFSPEFNRKKMNKDFYLKQAILKNDKLEKCYSFSCDQNFNIELTFNVNKTILGIYAHLHIRNVNTGELYIECDSTESQVNPLSKLLPGEHKFNIKFPSRTLAKGTYIVFLNFVSAFKASFHVDSPKYILTFELNDNSTNHGRTRTSHLSTLLKWEKIH